MEGQGFGTKTSLSAAFGFVWLAELPSSRSEAKLERVWGVRRELGALCC